MKIEIDSEKEFNKFATSLKKYFAEGKTPPKEDMEKIFDVFKTTIEKISYHKSRKSGFQFKDDIKQVCYLSLYSALKNYDQSKMNFKAYAVHWMFAYANMENKKALSMFKYGSRLDRKIFGKIATISDMPLEKQAVILGVSEQHLADFLNASRIPKSILKSRSEDSDIEEEEYLSTSIPSPDKLYELKVLYEKIKIIFEDFKKEINSDRDNDILTLLQKAGTPEKGNFKESELDEYPRNYNDIAEKYGVSRERIRQISCQIKDRLRHRFLKNGIDEKAYHAFI